MTVVQPAKPCVFVKFLAACALLACGCLAVWLGAACALCGMEANALGKSNETATAALQAQAQAILVLGAQVKAWGEPSEALRRRMDLALTHYRQKPRVIICCGGQGSDEPVAEGDFMRAWMIAHGVPEEDVYAEKLSRNTRENIAGAKKLLDGMGISSVLVVTSDYHVPRAVSMARRAGLTAVGSGSASRPDLWWKNHLREGLSWIKYLLGF